MRELVPAVRGSQEAGFTQPFAEKYALQCRGKEGLRDRNARQSGFLTRAGCAANTCAHRDHGEPRPLDDVVVVGVVVAVPAGRVHVRAGHHSPDGRLHDGQPPADGVIQSEEEKMKREVENAALRLQSKVAGCPSNSD